MQIDSAVVSVLLSVKSHDEVSSFKSVFGKHEHTKGTLKEGASMSIKSLTLLRYPRDGASGTILSLVLRFSQVLAKENHDLLNAVRPCLGISAGRGPAARRRIGVDARRNIAHRIRAIKAMMRSWIDFNRNRISSLLRCFGYFLTRFRRSPVIILANEDQQRRERLVDPRQVGMPATQPNSATRVERYRGGEASAFLSRE